MFPKFVQFQTQSACDGMCPYCPYTTMHTELTHGRMKIEDIITIIGRCAVHGVERIIPYLMNEPLLDDRMVHIIKIIRSVTDAWIELSTNARHLDEETANELRDIENLMMIFNINDRTPMMPIHEYIRRPYKGTVVPILYEDYMTHSQVEQITDILKHYGLTPKKGIVDDRAGNIPIADGHPRYAEGYCMENRLDEWMHILWNGDAILCCQDWARTKVLGNIFKSSMYVTFNSYPYQAVRLVKQDLCQRCARWIP